MSAPDKKKTLYYKECNKDQNASIIFLHGGGGSHIEWKHVARQPSMASYHLILVDLPMHSASHDIKPLTLETAADEVREVICNNAHGGKAHVVGFSLGGFVALALTSRHPDIVLSTFATGAYPYQGLFKWVMERPTAIWIVNKIQNIPGLTEMALKRQGIDYEEWMAEQEKNKSPERDKQMRGEVSEFSMEHVRAVGDSGVRTCVVAGGKMDQVEPVKEMGVVLRKGGHEKSVKNEAVVVRDAYHPWHLQLPELFASGVAAWVENQELPKEFERL
ncbi:ab hydrolase superfamily yvam [Fusarium sporotrichioides]|uniref:Ab hydrolase superfamily yvam n=1 Tax=Fusarium sporotrichioides TaxID=5514 RepID=A0A395SDC0_FUSSP|nr:ab hydrolase superfamily yvam [Fusarium sporotrichioides]